MGHLQRYNKMKRETKRLSIWFAWSSKLKFKIYGRDYLPSIEKYDGKITIYFYIPFKKIFFNLHIKLK
jgi:hypothetical protein